MPNDEYALPKTVLGIRGQPDLQDIDKAHKTMEKKMKQDCPDGDLWPDQLLEARNQLAWACKQQWVTNHAELPDPYLSREIMCKNPNAIKFKRYLIAAGVKWGFCAITNTDWGADKKTLVAARMERRKIETVRLQALYPNDSSKVKNEVKKHMQNFDDAGALIFRYRGTKEVPYVPSLDLEINWVLIDSKCDNTIVPSVYKEIKQTFLENEHLLGPWPVPEADAQNEVEAPEAEAQDEVEPTQPPVLEQVEATQDPALVANADELPFPDPLQQKTRGAPAWTPQGQAAGAGASEVADESAAEVGPTRKRGAEKEAESEAPSKKAKHAAAHAQKKAVAQKTTETEDGGYSLLPRGKHYAEGGVMTTGDQRTCLPDAMTVILCMLFKIPQSSVPTITKKTIAWFADRVRADPKREEGCDPNAFDAMAFGVANKFSLTYVPNTSPRVLLNFATGLFLVRLLIHYVHKGNNKIDTHFLVYDAIDGKIIDNLRGKGAVVVDASDRKDNKSAIRPFRKELFPEAEKVIVDAVYSASL